MKHLHITFCLLIGLVAGCSSTNEAEFPMVSVSQTIENGASTFNIEITDAALPVLKSALQSAGSGDAVLYSMEWPAGLCSTQHHLGVGKPSQEHDVATISGVRIAYLAKYKRFVNGTVIDYGSRGTESGLILENPSLDLYSIVHSATDSGLMTEMLGDGFSGYRDSVLNGDIILEPKSKAR